MKTLSLDFNTADPQAPHLLVSGDDLVGRVRDERRAKDIMLAVNAHDKLVVAVKAQSALEDLPFLDGELMLKECGWDGEQDIGAFVKTLRQAALAAAAAA